MSERDLEDAYQDALSEIDELNGQLRRLRRAFDESVERQRDAENVADELRSNLDEAGRLLAFERRRHRLTALRLADYE